MHKYKKHFTLQEANNLIPELKNLMRKIRSRAVDLKDKGFDVYKGKYIPGYHPDTYDEYPPEFRELIELMQQIHHMGIEIKGLEQGLIDFPALRENGEEVFLCWKLDEDEIGFWHQLKSGYAGRKTIEEF